uniref:Uncharacterized protein n=1 Tax=viral metagenome TaxID=1070528 RepID=A0A6C0D1G5_9ZZZZ
MSARARTMRRPKNPKHLRGSLHENTIVSRLPEGTPLQERWDAPNYYRGHRPGTRYRSFRDRFLQAGRQLSRRNPAQAALRLSVSRNYDNTNIDNVLKARSGWTEATNMVHNPLHGHWGAVGYPMAEATPVMSGIPVHEPGIPLSESHLYAAWRPVARSVIRPMTTAEMIKEERFRQRAAENAQRRARALYRSPRNISRSARKVRSFSLKKTKPKISKRSF